MKVKEIMSRDPAVCTPDTPLPEAARLMVEHDCGCIPVVETRDNRKPVGVVTDRDITCRVVAAGENAQEKTVDECMTTPCVTVTSETEVEDCCRTLEQNQIRRAVVVDDSGGCCGVVAQADIAKHGSSEQTHQVVQEVSQESKAASRVH